MTTFLIIAACLAAFYILLRMLRRSARSEGERDERIEQFEAADEHRAKVDKIANKVDAMPGDKVRDELKKWSRRSDKK